MAFSVDGIKGIGSELWNGYTYTGANGVSKSVMDLPGLKQLGNLSSKSDTFIKVATGAEKAAPNAGFIMRNASKGPLSWFGKAGDFASKKILTGANSVGTKMAANIAKGGLLSKVPFLGKVANGLKGLSKVPGLGVLITAGTALWGIGKAACKAFKGDFRGAGRDLLKTAGSTLGVAAGVALMATGVGFIPGLLLSVGAGFAGDWLGKKAADIVLPEQQAAAQGGISADPFDAKIDSLLTSIKEGPAFR